MSRLGDRMNAIRAALAAQFPQRVVTRTYKDFAQRADGELVKGIYTLVSAGERDYTNLAQYSAQDGTQDILIHGQLRIEEGLEGEALEEAELAMLDEIVAFCNALPENLCQLDLVGFLQSQQLENPYGWASFALEYRP